MRSSNLQKGHQEYTMVLGKLSIYMPKNETGHLHFIQKSTQNGFMI